MNTKIILAAVVGIIVGVGGVLAFDRGEISPVATTGTPSHMQQSNDSMMAELDGRQGDEFDRAFLEQMIVHHQGAIQMAEAALQNTKRDEIKQLSREIISAQNTEIKMMREWQASWYGIQQPVTSNDNAEPGGTVRNDQ